MQKANHTDHCYSHFRNREFIGNDGAMIFQIIARELNLTANLTAPEVFGEMVDVPFTRPYIPHTFLLTFNASVYSPGYSKCNRFVNDKSGHREPIRRTLAEGSPPCIPYESSERTDERCSEARQQIFKRLIRDY